MLCYLSVFHHCAKRLLFSFGVNPLSEIFIYIRAREGGACSLLENVTEYPPNLSLGQNSFSPLLGRSLPSQKNAESLRAVCGTGRAPHAASIGTCKTAPPQFGVWSLDEMCHSVTHNVTIAVCKPLSLGVYQQCNKALVRLSESKRGFDSLHPLHFSTPSTTRNCSDLQRLAGFLSPWNGLPLSCRF